VGFYDPTTGQHETFSMKADRVAARRLEIKSRAKEARRAERHSVGIIPVASAKKRTYKAKGKGAGSRRS